MSEIPDLSMNVKTQRIIDHAVALKAACDNDLDAGLSEFTSEEAELVDLLYEAAQCLAWQQTQIGHTEPTV